MSEVGESLAQRLTRRLSAVIEPAQRSGVVFTFCTDRPAEDVAFTLHALVHATIHGAGRDAWMAVVHGLQGRPLPYERIGEIYRIAAHEGLDVVKLMLIGRNDPSKHSQESDFLIDPLFDDLSLGERKSKARGHDSRLLERLLWDPDPAVIQILLGNPRVTEEQVVRLAAKRPNRPETFRVIANAPRWLRQASIQRAMVLNPYAPVQISGLLTPMLAPNELRSLAQDRTLHSILCTLGETLLRLRGEGPRVWH
jgi:hypothetical protein